MTDADAFENGRQKEHFLRVPPSAKEKESVLISRLDRLCVVIQRSKATKNLKVLSQEKG